MTPRDAAAIIQAIEKAGKKKTLFEQSLIKSVKSRIGKDLNPSPAQVDSLLKAYQRVTEVSGRIF